MSTAPTWSVEAILEILRDTLQGLGTTWCHPRIPPRSERGARRRAQLPDDEPILALVDRSLLGSGRRGVVITPRRVSLLEVLSAPLAMAWTDVFNSRLESTNLLRIGPHQYALTRQDARRVVRALEALRDALGGPEEPSHPALEAAIVEQPDDDQALAVYCDWLAERGEVRGRLGIAQHRGESIDALLKDNALELGLVSPGPAGLVRFRWRWGFWDELHLLPDVAFSGMAYDVARQALRHPSARFLRRLRVGSQQLAGPELDEVTRALGEVELPCLTHLAIECPTGHVRRDVALDRFPRLRQVTLAVHRVDPDVRWALAELGE